MAYPLGKLLAGSHVPKANLAITSIFADERLASYGERCLYPSVEIFGTGNLLGVGGNGETVVKWKIATEDLHAVTQGPSGHIPNIKGSAQGIATDQGLAVWRIGKDIDAITLDP